MLRTIRTEVIGKTTLRLVESKGDYTALAFGVDKSIKVRLNGSDPEELWRRLMGEFGKLGANYVGYAGAINRFLHFFPGGFHSDGYVNAEREYKREAKALLDKTAPLEQATEGRGFGQAVLKVFQATNLLSPFEKVRIQAVLKSHRADAFVQAAASFTMEPTAGALARMKESLAGDESAKWTVVTYLPYLWNPERHMFLKPEVTKDFASSVGHSFAHFYRPALDIEVYASLLELADEANREVASLKPRDRIDTQSFIWVVGSYEKGVHLPQP